MWAVTFRHCPAWGRQRRLSRSRCPEAVLADCTAMAFRADQRGRTLTAQPLAQPKEAGLRARLTVRIRRRVPAPSPTGSVVPPGQTGHVDGLAQCWSPQPASRGLLEEKELRNGKGIRP